MKKQKLTKRQQKDDMIVKVQVSHFSSDEFEGVLVYDEGKIFMQELPLRSAQERDELLNVLDEYMKGYFYAEIIGRGLILTGIAPWQSW